MGLFLDAIRGKKTISIIAEVKNYSPSFGKDFPNHDTANLIDIYEKNGAAAISIVTASKPFRGNLEMLRTARKLTKSPLLRKDFIVDKSGVDTSRQLGADAILLIAKNLSSDELHSLANYAKKIGLDVVIEIHTEEDLEKIRHAAYLKDIAVGINNRNLTNFSTDPNHALNFLDFFDQDQIIIAESAFRHPNDLTPYKGSVDAALIGTAFLSSHAPQEVVPQFTNFKNH